MHQSDGIFLFFLHVFSCSSLVVALWRSVSRTMFCLLPSMRSPRKCKINLWDLHYTVTRHFKEKVVASKTTSSKKKNSWIGTQILNFYSASRSPTCLWLSEFVLIFPENVTMLFNKNWRLRSRNRIESSYHSIQFKIVASNTSYLIISSPPTSNK